MSHPRHHLVLVLLIIASLFTAACSGDDTEPSMEMSDGEMEEEHDHEHDDAADAIPWDAEEIPELSVSVSGDAASGWDIAAVVSGFSFSDPSMLEHEPGWGHTHVFVDGQLVSMSYEPVVHIDDLAPGEHRATVTLSRNDHADYSLGGELITATETFTVEGDVEEADVELMVVYEGGEVSGVDTRSAASIGELVELTVRSDSTERVHVHGYDLFLEVGAGETGVLRFEAVIPGVFEVELEDDGELLFRLEVS